MRQLLYNLALTTCLIAKHLTLLLTLLLFIFVQCFHLIWINESLTDGNFSIGIKRGILASCHTVLTKLKPFTDGNGVRAWSKTHKHGKIYTCNCTLVECGACCRGVGTMASIVVRVRVKVRVSGGSGGLKNTRIT
jgi:hypothetical protein